MNFLAVLVIEVVVKAQFRLQVFFDDVHADVFLRVVSPMMFYHVGTEVLTSRRPIRYLFRCRQCRINVRRSCMARVPAAGAGTEEECAEVLRHTYLACPSALLPAATAHEGRVGCLRPERPAALASESQCFVFEHGRTADIAEQPVTVIGLDDVGEMNRHQAAGR